MGLAIGHLLFILHEQESVTACELHYVRRNGQPGGGQGACNVQVLSISRLSKGGWAKIAHHLGRAGPSAVQNITFKYRSLKKQAGTDASSGALIGHAAHGM